MTEDLFYWVALSLIPGVGSVLFKRLVDSMGKPEAVFRAPLRELLKVEGVGETVAREIQKGPSEKRVEKELMRVEQTGSQVLTFEDPGYPRRLREIYDPPPLLYVKGELKVEDDLALSIVGSRKTTPYGRWITERISQEIASHGVTIISGMARGIDSVAHGGAIAAGGRTLAILGCGVDVIYPRENHSLYRQIIDRGAVLSEFPMGSSPEAIHFPRRNRIISGLSIGVVVIQAGPKSGSLITADYALEQGRDVFAIPGNVGADGSRGCNRLIKQGAKLVESSEDILEEIFPQWEKEKQSLSKPPSPEKDLAKEERNIYDLLGDSPIHIDALIRESRLDPGRVSSLLMSLELKGLVLQWPGKCFTKKM